VKKVLATILAVLYLVTSSGAAVSFHFCMGKMYAVDFVAKDKCTKCGMKSGDGCCKDEVKFFKINDTHHPISSVNIAVPFFAVSPNVYHVLHPVFPENKNRFSFNNNSPPGSSGSSLCIKNCVFRL